MAEKTGIGWTDHTHNLAWGCVEASPGCDHCYARVQSARYGYDVWGPDKPRRTFGEKHWNEPRKWDREAKKAGVQRRVFCSSMTDNFLNDPVIDAEREKLWPLIRETPNLIWQLLTKHPERVIANLPSDWGDGYPNVHFGVTVEAEEQLGRADMLRKIPAPVRWISVEPMIGDASMVNLQSIDWVVIGGESGGLHRREMPLDAAKSLIMRCRDNAIAVFVKQDSGPRSGLQGRIPDWMWNLKEFP